MPITVERDLNRRWIHARHTGTMDLQEILTFLATERAEDRRMWPLVFEFIDSKSAVTDADLQVAADAVRKIAVTSGERGHVALVSADDEIYGMLLRYETMCAEHGVRVIRAFRRCDDAERWLEAVSSARYFT